MYAGYFYPELLDGLTSSSIIYCVGAGEDISHDIQVSHRCGAPVHIFDPTPRSIEHVLLVKTVLETGIEPAPNYRYGGGDPNYWKIILNNTIPNETIIFHPYGLFTNDIPAMRFYKPSNTEYVSHSIVEGMKSQEYIEVPLKSLKTIMSELGHSQIDLLKIDIEGCECDVLEQMIDDRIFPKYLSVDFDLGWTGEALQDRNRCIKVINKLTTNGYQILYSNGPDYSFMLRESFRAIF